MGRGRDGGGLCVRGYGKREGWGRFVCEGIRGEGGMGEVCACDKSDESTLK